MQVFSEVLLGGERGGGRDNDLPKKECFGIR